MSLSRRSLFVTSLALIAAPSIVRASSLMAMSPVLTANVSERWGYDIAEDATFVRYQRNEPSRILSIRRYFPLGDQSSRQHTNPYRLADLRMLLAA